MSFDRLDSITCAVKDLPHGQDIGKGGKVCNWNLNIRICKLDGHLNCMYVVLLYSDLFCGMQTLILALVLLSYQDHPVSYSTELQCNVGCKQQAYVHS